MLGPWGIRSTPSFPLLPVQLWPGVVAPDRALSMGKIEPTAYLRKTEYLEIEMFIDNLTVLTFELRA